MPAIDLWSCRSGTVRVTLKTNLLATWCPCSLRRRPGSLGVIERLLSSLRMTILPVAELEVDVGVGRDGVGQRHQGTLIGLHDGVAGDEDGDRFRGRGRR